MIFYAHSTDGDKSEWQTIHDHLSNTAKLTLTLGKDSGVEQYAYVAAMLHDIGKYSHAFQKRLEGASRKVDHSTAGAYEIRQLFNKTKNQTLLAELLAYCIAGHHGGLPDYGNSFDLADESTLQGRLKRKLEDYQAYKSEIDISRLQFPERLAIRPITKGCGFSLSFLTRMIYSVLVDADFQDTETVMNHRVKPRGGYENIETLWERYRAFLTKFDTPQNDIAIQRTRTLKQCIAKASEPPGLFTLTVPTGGGKTFSSLAFALNHAVIHGMKRIIYVIPYTTIIDQNAAEFKTSLGNENVLEHHSNFDWEKLRNVPVETSDDNTINLGEKLKLAAENWDIPIIVTTNVQFFESLFANRSSRCRKLHNLAKSVIVFDEAQMLPREFLKPCMYAVDELVQNYGSTAVICTATQPPLQQFFPSGTRFKELTDNTLELFNFYKRVTVENLGEISDLELSERINQQAQALCIVNTRKHASALFSDLQSEGRFHLSTLMCPTHRKEKITEIKCRLKNKLPCRVISTQLIEAGVDIDFPVGYRAIAGLDSIIQAAGRVNREGKLSGPGKLYIFEPQSEFVKHTPASIKLGRDVARSILRQYSNPICLEAIRDYYALLYDLQGPTAFDPKGILDCFEKGDPGVLDFDFKTAAEKFRLIDQPTVPVIIQYDENVKQILQEVIHDEYPLRFARRLQLYTVNIYEKEFEALQNKGVVDTYTGDYEVLSDSNEYYDAETGLKIPENSGGEAILFENERRQ